MTATFQYSLSQRLAWTLIAGVVLTTLAYTRMWSDGTVGSVVLSLAMGCSGLGILLEIHVSRLDLGPTGFKYRPPWGRAVARDYQAIQTIEVSKLLTVVRFADGGHVKIHHGFHRQIARLAEELETRSGKHVVDASDFR